MRAFKAGSPRLTGPTEPHYIRGAPLGKRSKQENPSEADHSTR
jgi:hypothetical protein